MAKTFRPYEPDQQFLLPPSLNDWLPEDHVARFIGDLVDSLDLEAIVAPYEKEERGYPPFHPVMMTKVILYGYSVGVYSSRRVAKALITDVAFRFLAAQARPDFRTLGKFRRRHRNALAGLFNQVLQMCRAAGLVKMGIVAVDGSKIKANASKRKAMSYQRMNEREGEFSKQIEEWFQRSDSEDDEDDRRHGKDKQGDELPEHLATKQKRLEKIREAKAALEKEAREKAEEQGEDPSKAKVDDKAQKNFTDPDSKILKTSDGFIQGYNAQAVVDVESQVIVAHDIFADGADSLHLVGMMEKVKEETGCLPGKAVADAGYYSEEGVKELLDQGIDPYVATKRQKHEEPPPAPRGRIAASATARQRMARKLLTKRGRAVYRHRKISVEPVFGQVKEARGFGRFSFRGIGPVAKEWGILCTVHNILKLFRSGFRWPGS